MRIDFIPPGPVSGAFLNAKERVTALVGPYGSGKTSTAMVAILKTAAEMPPDSDGVIRTRALWVRSTYQMLVSSSLPTIAKVLPPTVGKIRVGSPITHFIKSGNLELTIDFLALDMEADRRRIEGSTYGIIVVDEARDCPWSLIQVALTRLRETTNDGREKPLRAMFVSNPAGKTNWLYEKLVKNPVPGWRLFMQPGGRTLQAENMRFLPKTYYADMAATSDPSFVACHVDAQWTDVVIGDAVAPEFSALAHVAKEPLVVSPKLPLVIGLDAGSTLNPAAVIAQLLPLESGASQLRIVGEWHAANMGAQRGAHDLRAYVQRNWPEMRVEWGSVDPSAGQVRDAVSEQFFLSIWRAVTGWQLKNAPSNLLSIRVEAVRGMFQRLLPGGVPAIVISPQCSNLIRALAGEWRWKQQVTSQGIATKEGEVDKLNRPYADLGDALSYLALASGEWDVLREVRRKTQRPRGAVAIADGVDQGWFGEIDAPRQQERRGH